MLVLFTRINSRSQSQVRLEKVIKSYLAIPSWKCIGGDGAINFFLVAFRYFGKAGKLFYDRKAMRVLSAELIYFSFLEFVTFIKRFKSKIS